MQGGYANVYQTARKAAGYTQEHAAELLGVCVRSLANYESGVSVPPNDVVERMVIHYNNISLAYQHLHETNALMARVVPQLEQRNVLEVAVRIYLRMKRFNECNSVDRLMSIAADGRIDDDERPEFDHIMADLMEIIQSGLELGVFCCGNGEAGGEKDFE